MVLFTSSGKRREAVGRPEFPGKNRAEKDTKIIQETISEKKTEKYRIQFVSCRNIPAEKKYAIVEEVKRNKGSKAEILRREGLYSADLQRFEEIARDGAIKALGQSHPGTGRRSTQKKRLRKPMKP